MTGHADAYESAVRMLMKDAHKLGTTRAHEMALEDERALVKHAATLRIMQTENELTGKPHSASSAVAVVESDGGYALHRAKQREAVIDTQLAYANWEAAKMRARLVGSDT